MTFQFKSLLNEWYARCDETEWVLGTIYKTEGPCYRKVGAMMFFNGRGEQFGLLSGGCLEADIQQHARRVMQCVQATTLCYDGSDEDDISVQLGIGCGGAVYIALLPITRANNYLQLKEVHRVLSLRRTCTLQLKIPEGNGEAVTRLLSHDEDNSVDARAEKLRTCLVEEDEDQWLSVGLRTDPHLIVIGGGVDARPVISIARVLGWEVALWDSRPANARREHFMSASTIIECPVEQLGDYSVNHRVDAAIIMTHNVALDAASLRALSTTPLIYIGLLGPSARKLQVLEAANLDDDQIKHRLYGPAGFDLGGNLPESIALSILSECHAHISGHSERSAFSKS